MGRRQGGPSRTGAKGAYLNRYVTDLAIAGQPPAHFHRNPLGQGQLAVFPSRDCLATAGLDPNDSDMGALPPVRLGPP
jgi:hypothetical protein